TVRLWFFRNPSLRNPPQPCWPKREKIRWILPWPDYMPFDNDCLAILPRCRLTWDFWQVVVLVFFHSRLNGRARHGGKISTVFSHQNLHSDRLFLSLVLSARLSPHQSPTISIHRP